MAVTGTGLSGVDALTGTVDFGVVLASEGAGIGRLGFGVATTGAGLGTGAAGFGGMIPATTGAGRAGIEFVAVTVAVEPGTENFETAGIGTRGAVVATGVGINGGVAVVAGFEPGGISGGVNAAGFPAGIWLGTWADSVGMSAGVRGKFSEDIPVDGYVGAVASLLAAAVAGVICPAWGHSRGVALSRGVRGVGDAGKVRTNAWAVGAGGDSTLTGFEDCREW